MISSERNLAKYVPIKDNWQDFLKTQQSSKNNYKPFKSTITHPHIVKLEKCIRKKKYSYARNCLILSLEQWFVRAPRLVITLSLTFLGSACLPLRITVPFPDCYCTGDLRSYPMNPLHPEKYIFSLNCCFQWLRVKKSTHEWVPEYPGEVLASLTELLRTQNSKATKLYIHVIISNSNEMITDKKNKKA